MDKRTDFLTYLIDNMVFNHRLRFVSVMSLGFLRHTNIVSMFKNFFCTGRVINAGVQLGRTCR